MPIKNIFLIILLSTTLFSSSQTFSQEVVERVVAVVNEEAIFLSDVREKAMPFLPQLANIDSVDMRRSKLHELEKQIVSALIDEKLLSSEAHKLNLSVTPEEMNRAIKNWQKQYNLDDESFWKAVEAQGQTRKKYRSELKKQLLRYKLLNQKVRARINISDKELRRQYENLTRNAKRSYRYHAAHIIFPLSPDLNDAEKEKIRLQAIEIQKTLTKDNFLQKAEELKGGDLGWLEEGDLPEVLDQILQDMKPNEISQPIRGGSGFHIFILLEKEKGSSDVPTFAEMKDKIMQDMMSKAMAKQEKIYLENLRRQAAIKNYFK